LFLLAGLLSAIIFPLITINYSVTIPQIQESVSVGEFSATAVNTIQTPLITWEVIAAGVQSKSGKTQSSSPFLFLFLIHFCQSYITGKGNQRNSGP
jgi:hypothetical protein